MKKVVRWKHNLHGHWMNVNFKRSPLLPQHRTERRCEQHFEQMNQIHSHVYFFMTLHEHSKHVKTRYNFYGNHNLKSLRSLFSWFRRDDGKDTSHVVSTSNVVSTGSVTSSHVDAADVVVVVAVGNDDDYRDGTEGNKGEKSMELDSEKMKHQGKRVIDDRCRILEKQCSEIKDLMSQVMEELHRNQNEMNEVEELLKRARKLFKTADQELIDAIKKLKWAEFENLKQQQQQHQQQQQALSLSSSSSSLTSSSMESSQNSSMMKLNEKKQRYDNHIRNIWAPVISGLNHAKIQFQRANEEFHKREKELEDAEKKYVECEKDLVSTRIRYNMMKDRLNEMERDLQNLKMDLL